MLEQSYVFRQLSAPGRFGKYDFIDGVLALEPYALHYIAELVFDGNVNRAWVTLAASVLGVWLLRRFYPDGVGPLVRIALTPKRLSAFPPDRILLPYPAVARVVRDGRRT
jgi:hypothetical protein